MVVGGMSECGKAHFYKKLYDDGMRIDRANEILKQREREYVAMWSRIDAQIRTKKLLNAAKERG